MIRFLKSFISSCYWCWHCPLPQTNNAIKHLPVFDHLLKIWNVFVHRSDKIYSHRKTMTNGILSMSVPVFSSNIYLKIISIRFKRVLKQSILCFFISYNKAILQQILKKQNFNHYFITNAKREIYIKCTYSWKKMHLSSDILETHIHVYCMNTFISYLNSVSMDVV